MTARAWRLAKGGATATIAGLLVGAGCTDLLGFERSPRMQCIRNSDCPQVPEQLFCLANICTKQCFGDIDCTGAGPGSTCDLGSHACVQVSRPHVGLDGSGDVGLEAASEAGSVDVSADAVPGADREARDDAQDVGPDEATDSRGDALQTGADAPLNDSAAPDAGGCAQTCQPPAYCKGSTCYPTISIGYSMGADTGVGALTDQNVTCVQLTVPRPLCGYITGIGFSVVSAVSAQFRFGLYDDDGGLPSVLRAQTDVQTLIGNRDELNLAPPVLVGCGLNDRTFYWACFVSSARLGVDLAAVSGSQSWWATGLATASQLRDYLQTGMPVTNPTSGSRSLDLTPLVYALFAETPP